MKKNSIYIDNNVCTNCGLCVKVCLLKVIEQGEEAARITEPSLCLLCGHCKSVCPVNALHFFSFVEKEFGAAPAKDDIPKPDQLLAFFRSRRSVRFFKKDSVEKEILEKIIEAGRYAPTGGNFQSIGYIVVNRTEKIKTAVSMAIDTLDDLASKAEHDQEKGLQISEQHVIEYESLKSFAPYYHYAAEQYKQGIDLLLYNAPALIICHVPPSSSTHPEVEAGMAAMQMVLMAEALGLGTCFTGSFDFAVRHSTDLRRVLHLPEEDKEPVSFVVGYTDIIFHRLVARKPARVTWL